MYWQLFLVRNTSRLKNQAWTRTHPATLWSFWMCNRPQRVTYFCLLSIVVVKWAQTSDRSTAKSSYTDAHFRDLGVQLDSLFALNIFFSWDPGRMIDPGRKWRLLSQCDLKGKATGHRLVRAYMSRFDPRQSRERLCIERSSNVPSSRQGLKSEI